MINLFQPAANDQSLYYLGQLFGYVGNVLPVSKPSLILGMMFKTFNAIVLAVGALIVVYTTVVGLLKTAQEGEFLGRNWNSIWIPIRTVLGIAALVPSTSGYSGIQIIMMWIIVQGIGAADTVWTTVLQYVDTFGSITANPSIPTNGITNTMENLFQSLVCQATAQAPVLSGQPTTPPATPKDGRAYYCADPDNPNNAGDPICGGNFNAFSPATESSSITLPGNIVLNFSTYPIGPQKGECGVLTYCDPSSNGDCKDPSSLSCTACKAQISALQSIVPTLTQIAQQLASADYQYVQFSNGGSPPSWVNTYCSDNNISAECCKYQTAQTVVIQAMLAIAGATSSPPTCIASFYTSGWGGTGAGNNAMQKLYWPYVISPLVQNSNFIQDSVNLYVGTISTAVASQMLSQNTQLSSDMQKIQGYGWLFAGAYYYYISQNNTKNLKLTNPYLSVEYNGGFPDSPKNNDLYPNYRTNYGATGNLLDFIADPTGSGAGAFSGMPKLKKVSAVVNKTGQNLLDNFMKTVTGSSGGQQATNVLISLQSLGASLLLTIEIFFTVFLAVTLILGLTGNIDVFVLGTGAIDPLGPAAGLVYMVLIPLIFGFIGLFLVFGGLLAVYTPLIPYIIFMMGGISWFISTIEAMVAAPLVALGILSPGGQHEILGRAEPALMMIFGIFLRPSLMIFGLIAGMLLSIVAVTMINASFSSIMSQITAYSFNQKGSGSPDFLELIFFMAAYVFLIVAVLNKSFALIHIIPDRTLVWIGGQPGAAGHEAEAGLAEGKRGVEAAGAGVSRGAAAAPETAGKAGATATSKGREKKKKERESTQKFENK